MVKSTRSRRVRKPAAPEKPYPDFPLTPRRDGRWCKKILGKVHIFGSMVCLAFIEGPLPWQRLGIVGSNRRYHPHIRA